MLLHGDNLWFAQSPELCQGNVWDGNGGSRPKTSQRALRSRKRTGDSSSGVWELFLAQLHLLVWMSSYLSKKSRQQLSLEVLTASFS